MQVSIADLEDHIQVLESLIDDQEDDLASLLQPIVDSLELIVSKQHARKVADELVNRWYN